MTARELKAARRRAEALWAAILAARLRQVLGAADEPAVEA